MRLKPGPDDTVRVPTSRPQKGAGAPIAIAAIVLALLAASGWLLWSRFAPQPSPPVAGSLAPAPTAPPAPPSVARAPAFPITTATEQEILDHTPTELTVFRFVDNPKILVLDFASLYEQGKMLNRVAALVEKAGLPRDRVLSDEALNAAIHAQGDTVETFYYGHDYSAAALARFFGLADSEHVALDPEEERLRALMRQEGWFGRAVAAGLISLTAVGSSPKITLAVRAAILRHELSHGEFFSEPAYAAYVHNFWLTELTEAERSGVRKFLAKEGYDAGEEELMYNEMQAYLMFTRDPLFFAPQMAELTPARLAELQTRFLAGMPEGWLHDVLASYQDAASAR